MNNRSEKSMSITQKKIAVPKSLPLICAIIAFLLDLVVIWVIAEYVSELKFLICPILLAALDLIFIFKVLLSNYRFAYSIYGVLIHIACVVVVCAFSILSTGLLEERIIFADIALYAMPAVHLLQCFASLLNAVHCMNHRKIFRKIVAIVTTVVFVVGVGVYGRYLVLNGFFGQGNIRMQRTITYQLDDSESSYIVTGVLKGKGNAVTIPEFFNGLPVTGIDCMLFTNDGLQYVTLDCGADIQFLNVSSLNHVNDNIRIETAKIKLDSFRNSFYELALENEQLLQIANNVYPSDMEDGEVYVTFSYTYDALKLVKGEILPSWFGREGEVFDIYQHAPSVSYIKNSNALNADNLYWCYENQERKIFREAVNSNNENVNNTEISDSMTLSLKFDSIYQLKFEEDNDTKYEIAEEFTTFATSDGTKREYRLDTRDHIVETISAIPQRNGFELNWFVGSDKREIKDMAADISMQLDALDQSGMFTLLLHPVWTLQAPTIDYVTADGKSANHSAIYGSDVVLDSSAKSPHESIYIKYEWKYLDVIGNSNKYTIRNLHPQDAGTYTLAVTAYSDSTSLTNTVEATINVGFEKKELNFFWSVPTGSDTVYSATEKPISALYDSADVINEDVIESSLTKNSVRNVGTYTIELNLVGDAATKYQIAQADKARELTITPYSLSVKWSTATSFVYDGTDQAPDASALGLGDDGQISISVSGRKNVGKWDAEASTTNKNYVLLENTKPCEITPRPISKIIWKDLKTFVYNGKAQGVSVGDMENVLPSEKSYVIAGLQYEGMEINVGTDYTIKALLPENSNYIFACDVYQQYDITPKKLEIDIEDKTFVYSGKAFDQFSFKFSALASTDSIEEILSLTYTGEAVSAINVNAAGYEIDADITELSKYNNYDVTLKAGLLKITPKHLVVKLSNVEKIYDGKVYPIDEYTFTTEGLVESDSISDVLALEYMGEALSAVNYKQSGYEIDAKVIGRSKFENYTVAILKASLKIKKAPLTITAIGSNKVYDGTPHNDFDFKVSGLVNDETVEQLGLPRYSGEATYNKNVGKHSLLVKLPDNDVTANYQITAVNGECEISPKSLTVTAIGGNKIYDGTPGGAFSFKADGLVENDKIELLGTPQYSGAAKTDKNVGVHTLAVSLPSNTATNNYNITYIDGIFEITKKKVSVSVIENFKIYDGKIGGNFDFAINGLVSGDTEESFGTPKYSGTATEYSAAGEYTLSVKLPGNSNYEIVDYKEGVYTIQKRKMTITPISTTKVYDGSKGGEFDFVVSGLADGETKEMLGKPTFSGSAITAKNVGKYSLIVSIEKNEMMNNYDISYLNGTFEIVKKGLTVTAICQDRVYGEEIGDSFSITVEGLVNGETIDQLGTPIYCNEALQSKDVGTYTLTVSFAENGVTRNYDIICISDTFEITKKDLTITAVAEDRKYDETVVGGNFSYLLEGIVDGDEQYLGEPVYSGSAVTATESGSYILRVEFTKFDKANNYNIIYVEDLDFVISAPDADQAEDNE